MKKVLRPLSLMFGLYLLLALKAWAVPLQMEKVYWDLSVSYGSGSSAGQGQIDSDIDQKLPPSSPDILPNTGSVEVTDDPIDPAFYSYASFDADESYLDVYTEGFAGDYDPNNVDWYSGISKAAIGTDLFYGLPSITIAFDWSVTFDLDTAYNYGLAKIGIGLVDWTATTDPNNPIYFYKEVLDYSDSDSGSYYHIWNNLDPAHQYVLGVGALASIGGADDTSLIGGLVEIEIKNLEANAVPEPCTLFLLGAGLLGIRFLSKREKI